jgi:hypothetical protein
MAKNLCGKTRDINDPYEVWVRGDWEWRVLKKYKSPESEAKDPYARWFVAAKSPMTYGSYDLGDEYAANVKGNAAYRMPDDKMEKHLATNQW